MNKERLELYTDYLLSTFGYATSTGLSTLVHGQVSHDKVTRFLAEEAYTSKDLWQAVKATVRQVVFMAKQIKHLILWDAGGVVQSWRLNQSGIWKPRSYLRLNPMYFKWFLHTA